MDCLSKLLKSYMNYINKYLSGTSIIIVTAIALFLLSSCRTCKCPAYSENSKPASVQTIIMYTDNG